MRRPGIGRRQLKGRAVKTVTRRVGNKTNVKRFFVWKLVEGSEQAEASVQSQAPELPAGAGPGPVEPLQSGGGSAAGAGAGKTSKSKKSSAVSG